MAEFKTKFGIGDTLYHARNIQKQIDTGAGPEIASTKEWKVEEVRITRINIDEKSGGEFSIEYDLDNHLSIREIHIDQVVTYYEHYYTEKDDANGKVIQELEKNHKANISKSILK